MCTVPYIYTDSQYHSTCFSKAVSQEVDSFESSIIVHEQITQARETALASL